MANRKSPWLTQDGKFRTPKVLSVMPKIKDGKFLVETIIPSFMNSALSLEALADSNKIEFSQLIFGKNDLSLAELSDSEFFPAKKTAIKEQNNIFYNNLVNYSPMLTGQIAQINPQSLESFIFSKARNVKNSAFVIPREMVAQANDDKKEFFKDYNFAARSIQKYHSFKDHVAEIGSEAFAFEKLSNLTNLQRLTVNMATSGNPYDSSRIVRIFEEDYKERALGAISKIGISSYTAQNLGLSRSLKNAHDQAIEQQNQEYEAARANIRLTGSLGDLANLESKRIENLNKIAEKYQYAATDSDPLFRSYVGKMKDAIERHTRDEEHYQRLAQAQQQSQN